MPIVAHERSRHFQDMGRAFSTGRPETSLVSARHSVRATTVLPLP